MKKQLAIYILLVLFFVIASKNTDAQISPGDLCEPHAHLEGMTNCTLCHILGDKVSNEKCLDCHKELKSRITQNKGYHVSTEVKGKECVSCHNDHHGRKFEVVRFQTDKFDHKLAGYALEGAHAKKECKDCHKPENITNADVKKLKFTTYLGLTTECLSCHVDYHQKTLSSSCLNCHDYEAFKPAPKFDHNKAKFKLVGKHTEVACIDCHKKEQKAGKDYQVFAGLEFNNCTACHKDAHENKFGQDCRQCHTEQSFHTIKGMKDFDHSKTNFKLEGKHTTVSCTLCHKTNLTDALKHERCIDCHTDYHEKQFVKDGKTPDCNECHSVKGFVGSSYTIEKHALGNFPLKGAHLATPCFVCHKKQVKWSFKKIGSQCVDCHENIHKDFISQKYYPNSDCKICHTENMWPDVNFDHNTTPYPLEGAHKDQGCRECHFKVGTDGEVHQQFSGLSQQCSNCHKDSHQNQFEKNGVTDCKACHEKISWDVKQFNHNVTRFKLEGKHAEIACKDCHKEAQDKGSKFVLYKINEFRCEDCHH
ncbi:MAG: cytochrome C [Bacteroidales bacterium]|nr:cytochrome C [Bacteroidales bacterium]